MSAAEEKKGQSGANPSMEDILQSIRGVISGDEPHDASDVLELVEVVEEGSMANALMAAASEEKKEEPLVTEKSILDDIDAALDDGSTKQESVAEAPILGAGEHIPPSLEPETEEPVLAPAIVEESMVVQQEIEVVEVASKTEVANQPEAEVSEVHHDVSYAENLVKHNAKSPRLLDEDAAQQSSVSLKALVSTIHDKHVESPHTRGGTSLEDLVIEAMKPFLAEWLNKNLPVIVKKIVEKEVKRLIPKEEDDY